MVDLKRRVVKVSIVKMDYIKYDNAKDYTVTSQIIEMNDYITKYFFILGRFSAAYPYDSLFQLNRFSFTKQIKGMAQNMKYSF